MSNKNSEEAQHPDALTEIQEVLKTAFEQCDSYEACPELSSSILYAISFRAGIFDMPPLEQRLEVIEDLKQVFVEDHPFWGMIEIPKHAK